MNNKYYYAGIGSRETPKEVLQCFGDIARYLAKNNFILRSGGANGADHWFEKGCDLKNGEKEIYLPWSRFNGSNSNLVLNDLKAYEIAKKFYPYWNNLKDGTKKLQARNSYQVLGYDLNTPSDFIICYTKNGKGQGGTGQAIRIAKYYNIKIFDCGGYKNISNFKEDLWNYLKELIEKEN